MVLPEFRLETYMGRWEFEARYHLTASDAETMALEDLLLFADDADRRRWRELRLGYIETRGTPELRDAVARTYERVTAGDVLCFAGAEEGLYCTMHALLKPGDHAIVLVPNYQSTESVPLSICEVSGIALEERDNWNLDLDRLRSLIRPNTALIAVNFPNNPTGKVVSRATFEALIDLCAARDIAFFSDEVYRGVERDPSKTLPQAADLYDRAFSLNVVSKAYGLPGLRVGWIASRDRAALDRMEKTKQYLSICNAAPSEVLACIAVKAGRAIFQRNRAICTENLERLRAFFDNHAEFEWYEPDGGCVAFPRYTGGDVEAFCEQIVSRAGILLLPASQYYSELLPVAKDRFRIGYGRLGMEQALEAFEGFLSAGNSGAMRR